MTPVATATLDLREIPPAERHPAIFSTFLALDGGESMEIVNDHDPQPLRRQFQAELEGQFEWLALEAGPQTWRVAIKRTVAARSGCCGACGGGA
jgi:uncharacterized protein (DUF2249 family)